LNGPAGSLGIRRWIAFLSDPVVREEGSEDRSEFQRLAIPFTFPPQLSFPEAVIAAIAACLRLLLGSVLFAVWGACSLAVWSTVRNLVLRTGLLLALLAGFLIALALVLLVIKVLVRLVWPKP
jgi:hypothetical protein